MGWTTEHTISLLAKATGLVIGLIRKFADEPEKAITHIENLTLEMRERDRDIDEELRLLRESQREGGGE